MTAPRGPKVCVDCKVEKPWADFNYPNSKTCYRRCNPCRRKRSREMGVDFRSNLKRTYGLTIEQYTARLEAQANKCAICAKELKPGKGTHVDHCHATGRLRGMLCPACNMGLGHFKDSVAFCEEAARYLKRYSY